MSLRFTIPGEALSLNNAYRSFVVRGRPRRALTAEGKAFKGHASAHVRVLGRRPPAGHRLRVTLDLYGRWDTLAGEPLRRDIDNHAKLVLDALCAELGIDDRWIRRLEIEAIHDPTPRIEVTVRW